MNLNLRSSLILLCLLALGCRRQTTHSERTDLNEHSYIQILERIERAGNRYREAMDLQKYTSSAVERSLADSHLQLTRSILESEFQLAEVESKDLAQVEADSNSPTAPTAQADQTQYEKAAADVWKVYRDVEEANKRLEAARQNLKKATTAESFHRAQQTVDQAQKELELANKKLNLAGSTLEIEDYERKKAAPQVVESHSLVEHLKTLREELFPPAPKANANPVIQPKVTEEPKSSASSGGGIVASFREYFIQQNELGTLTQAYEECQRFLEEIKASLAQRSQRLERLQVQHIDLNKKVEEAYNQAYELLKAQGTKASTAQLMEEADRQMAASAGFDQQKELTSRAIGFVRRQVVLFQEDSEKLANWVEIARGERNQSLSKVSTRLGIVLALILLILLLAYYLKKLPYKFIKEGKSLYYFRKLIGFSAGLMIGLIILLNFVGDFGSISAVVGLAGAGLAIALQDPIVSLVAWFLIIGKSGITVGDRVEINNVKGDVIDVGVLRTAVLEVGNWVSAEQSTGRVVFFPNSFIFKHHFFNYSTGNSFIWDEIHITVTYESDWKKAREIIENVAQRVSSEFVEKARAGQERVSRRFHINLGTLTPYVYVSIAGNGVDLVLRYLTEIRRRRLGHDQICREILEAFDREPSLDLAYPTTRSVTQTRTLPPTPQPVSPSLRPERADHE